MKMPLLIEQTYSGKNVRQWTVSRRDGAGTGRVSVRESALAPGVYTCLTCIDTTCDHANAVREIDRTVAAK